VSGCKWFFSLLLQRTSYAPDLDVGKILPMFFEALYDLHLFGLVIMSVTVMSRDTPGNGLVLKYVVEVAELRSINPKILSESTDSAKKSLKISESDQHDV